MLRFLLHRLGQLVFTLWAVATLIFFMLRVLPGDPIQFKYTSEGGSITAEQLQVQRARFGYDKPLATQYANWIVGLTRMDLGTSVWSENPISQEIRHRFGVTFQLAVAALVIGLLLALPLGITAALARGTWLDQFIRVCTVTGQSIPSFWMAMLVILALLSTTGWIPSNTAFDITAIKYPVVLDMWKRWGLSENIPYLSNLVPGQFYEQALLPTAQQVVEGKITGAEAGELAYKVAKEWRDFNPDMVENYKKWAADLSG